MKLDTHEYPAEVVLAKARQMVAELERLRGEVAQVHILIRRGLAYGDQFRTPLAAGARAELRAMAGMTPPGRREATETEVRANWDGRWDTWGGDGVGP